MSEMTCSEFDDGNVPRINVTEEALDWDLSDRDFAEHEG